MKRQADQLITAIDDLPGYRGCLQWAVANHPAQVFPRGGEPDQADRRFLMADDPNFEAGEPSTWLDQQQRTANDRCVDTLGTRRQQ